MPITAHSEVGEGRALVCDESLRIPANAYELQGFRTWAHSDRFPATGRIDYLGGDVEVEVSPEDLHTHGTVKTAIAAELFGRIARPGRGFVFVDRTRVTSPISQLSVEPDVVVVLFTSLDKGKIRQMPASAKGEGRFIELEGAPDLVVEVLSDSSVHKDTERLPPRYARAGVGELWLVDARGEDVRLEVRVLEGSSYRIAEPDSEGWAKSTFLDGRVRLTRQATPHGGWLYQLEHEAS